jgi:hypothetical protein
MAGSRKNLDNINLSAKKAATQDSRITRSVFQVYWIILLSLKLVEIIIVVRYISSSVA